MSITKGECGQREEQRCLRGRAEPEANLEKGDRKEVRNESSTRSVQCHRYCPNKILGKKAGSAVSCTVEEEEGEAASMNHSLETFQSQGLTEWVVLGDYVNGCKEVWSHLHFVFGG